ncbi:MAG: PilZ domain-containing protein [Paracoccaceae bacterium]
MSFPNPFKRMFTPQPATRRQMERFYAQLPATIFADGAEPVDCTLLDYSDMGARLQVPEGRRYPDGFKIYVPETDMPYVAEVRRRRDNEAEIFFLSAEPGRKPWVERT